MYTDNIDSDIAYWASLCEDTSAAEAKKNSRQIDEAYAGMYSYDVTEGADRVVTVKQLKDILSNFKDTDTLVILGEGNQELEVKAAWNSDMERDVTGIDVEDNICFIRLD